MEMRTEYFDRAVKTYFAMVIGRRQPASPAGSAAAEGSM
jgi:hypothetical protein